MLQIVHPKSDEQRKRLSEAVKPIFLFRSLEPVSYIITWYQGPFMTHFDSTRIAWIIISFFNS